MLEYLGIRYVAVTAARRKDIIGFLIKDRQCENIQCNAANGADLLAGFGVRQSKTLIMAIYFRFLEPEDFTPPAPGHRERPVCAESELIGADAFQSIQRLPQALVFVR